MTENSSILFPHFLSTPVGWLCLQMVPDPEQIVSIRFADNPAALFPNYARSGTSRQPLYRECEKQLKAYFAGQRRSFDFPMEQPGTDFQQRVWNALLRIPFGKTIRYLNLSIQLGDAKAIRAVGTANGKNNLAIVVPCHRVIGSNGKLVGYAGGLARMQWLLEHEARWAHGVQTMFDGTN